MLGIGAGKASLWRSRGKDGRASGMSTTPFDLFYVWNDVSLDRHPAAGLNFFK